MIERTTIFTPIPFLSGDFVGGPDEPLDCEILVQYTDGRQEWLTVWQDEPLIMDLAGFILEARVKVNQPAP